ncbi:MAG: ATP-grasp domain-containing protein [Bacteroidota bacterium]
MRRKLLIAIVYNEPTVQTREGRKFISETGVLQEGANNKLTTATGEQVLVDLSEVGVVEAMEDIRAALISLAYKAVIFNVDGNIHRLIDFLEEVQPDLVFNLCESHGAESMGEMYIAGLYEVLDIPYTGSPPLTLGTALKKARAKEILAYYGIPSPKFRLYKVSTRITVDESMEFPMIVKPSHEDASVGIDDQSIVEHPAELRGRIRHIIEKYDQPALVEEYIPGRELNVAIIGNSKPIVLPISEIDFSTVPENLHHIVSYEAKWVKGTAIYEETRGICPAPLSSSVEARVKEIALQAYQILGCRDYARLDMRLAKDNQLYLLEVNPNPDLSDDAGFARSARRYGFTFAEMVGKIVEFAIERTP